MLSRACSGEPVRRRLRVRASNSGRGSGGVKVETIAMRVEGSSESESTPNPKIVALVLRCHVELEDQGRESRGEGGTCRVRHQGAWGSVVE
jgi:hypothetical protein